MFKLFIIGIYLSISIANAYVVAMPIQNFSPQYQVKADKKSGFLPIILKKFSKDKGVELKIVSLPVKRYIQMVIDGKVDFILPDNKTWLHNDNLKKFIFSDPIMQSRVSYFSHEENSKSIKDIKSIATISGYTLDYFSKEIKNKKIKVNELQKIESLMSFINQKRADLGYFHDDILEDYLLRNKKLKLKKRSDIKSDLFTYHLSTIKHPEIINQFNQWMKENQSWIKEKKEHYLID